MAFFNCDIGIVHWYFQTIRKRETKIPDNNRISLNIELCIKSPKEYCYDHKKNRVEIEDPFPSSLLDDRYVFLLHGMSFLVGHLWLINHLLYTTDPLGCLLVPWRFFLYFCNSNVAESDNGSRVDFCSVFLAWHWGN